MEQVCDICGKPATMPVHGLWYCDRCHDNMLNRKPMELHVCTCGLGNILSDRHKTTCDWWEFYRVEPEL